MQNVQYAVGATAEKWLKEQTRATAYGDLASGRRELEQNLAANLGREFPSWGIELCECRMEGIEPA